MCLPGTVWFSPGLTSHKAHSLCWDMIVLTDWSQPHRKAAAHTRRNNEMMYRASLHGKSGKIAFSGPQKQVWPESNGADELRTSCVFHSIYNSIPGKSQKLLSQNQNPNLKFLPGAKAEGGTSQTAWNSCPRGKQDKCSHFMSDINLRQLWMMPLMEPGKWHISV